MKRKSCRAKKQKTSLMSEDLELMEVDAAAIDIGSRSHWVAVNPQGVSEPVREFKTFTPDLNRLGDWLTECGATSVVMEATGVYWVPLYVCRATGKRNCYSISESGGRITTTSKSKSQPITNRSAKSSIRSPPKWMCRINH